MSATNNETLYTRYMRVLNEVPNFVTDSRADVHGKAGNRTYKYLNLSTILKEIKPIFAKHNIGFYQNVTFENDKIGYVETVIITTADNDDMQSLTVGKYPFMIVPDPQAIGSAVTYARRYSLYAALGIYPDKDDDGAAMRDYVNPQQTNKINPQQYQELQLIAAQNGLNLSYYVKNVLQRPVNRPQDLTVDDYQMLINAMPKK